MSEHELMNIFPVKKTHLGVCHILLTRQKKMRNIIYLDVAKYRVIYVNKHI